MRIKLLSETVANQIAAGEVIENPASVVKELLENALDAHATVITIDVGFGGLNQIKVSDNGDGICTNDLSLAIAPHATSKLTKLQDLATLTSMGFRGEALASIASVSKLVLISKPALQETAMMLQQEGNTWQVTPCARSQGTTVDVRDLFYNAPVRRRFLKSERLEFLNIEQVVKRFALSASHITLVLKHHDRVVLDLPAATHAHSLNLRIQRIMGKAFLESAIAIDVTRAGMHLTGQISGLAYQRSQNDKQWIYLNQRMVKDKLIQHALKQAYENKLHPGRYPACLLYLTMPTDEVDVNVHPTKHEVRFQQPRLVHDFIGSQIAEALFAVSPQEIHFPEPSLGVESYYLPPERQIPLVLAERTKSSPRYDLDLNAPAWTVINANFGLIRLEEHIYLFEVSAAQRERCLAILNKGPRPLASRPLLVPMRVAHAHSDLYEFKQTLAAWLPFGIGFEIKEANVILNRLPISMPQLDVQQLLHRAHHADFDPQQISEILATCQPLDARQFSADEKNVLAEFVLEQLNQTVLPPWCVCLDVQRCEGLLHA